MRFHLLSSGLALLAVGGIAQAAGTSASDQLDELDRQEFQAQIAKAQACVRSRDVPCVNRALQKASGLASSSEQRDVLAKTYVLAQEAAYDTTDGEAEARQRAAAQREAMESRAEETARQSSKQSRQIVIASERQAADAQRASRLNPPEESRTQVLVPNLSIQRMQRPPETHARAEQGRAGGSGGSVASGRSPDVLKSSATPRVSTPGVQKPNDKASSQHAATSLAVAETKPQVGTPESPDKDGCYIPVRANPLCVAAEGKWSKGTSGEYKVRYTNNCRARVYLSTSIQRKDGSWDSGADGLRVGATTTWWTGDSTGQHAYRFTGSTKSENDWVCGDRDAVFKAQRK